MDGTTTWLPKLFSFWMEVNAHGSLFIDDSHKDVHLNTVRDGIDILLAPGEPVEHQIY